jgi:glycosyltransferase involved in cell wall biosynthesis
VKIIVATAQAPFVVGGAEFLARNLINALEYTGHEVELVNIPFFDVPIESIESQILAMRLLEVERTWAGNSDLCIGLKFPAYYIKHSNKVVWALHQYRAVYDLWGSDYSNMHLQPDGLRIKKVIHHADGLYLREASRIYTISNNVTKRMKKFNQLDSTCLYHPCPDMEKFYCNRYDNYILMPSRINVTKRQMLAVEAMALTKSDIKLYIVGKADNIIVSDEIRQYVKNQKLDKTVLFYDHVSQEEKFKLYANARAVMFIPYDEDYGYISLESMSASKPIITAKDSGGTLEFVENGKTGLVVDPTPADIARAIDEFAAGEVMSKEMGEASKKHIMEMNITWDNVVKELTK